MRYSRTLLLCTLAFSLLAGCSSQSLTRVGDTLTRWSHEYDQQLLREHQAYYFFEFDVTGPWDRRSYPAMASASFDTPAEYISRKGETRFYHEATRNFDLAVMLSEINPSWAVDYYPMLKPEQFVRDKQFGKVRENAFPFMIHNGEIKLFAVDKPGDSTYNARQAEEPLAAQ